MTTRLANIFETAVRDGSQMVPWIAPNSAALQWEPLEEAVLGALGGPVPTDFAMGVPLLKFANGREAMPLVEAILSPPIPRKFGRRNHGCDVSGTTMREPNTLWVPCGASVVQVTMRNQARGILQDLTRCNLVWE